MHLRFTQQQRARKREEMWKVYSVHIALRACKNVLQKFIFLIDFTPYMPGSIHHINLITHWDGQSTGQGYGSPGT